MKTKNLILLLLTIVAAVCFSFGALTTVSAAKGDANAVDLWTTNSTGVDITVGESGGMNLKLPSKTAATYKNNVDFSDMEATMTFASLNYKTFSIRFTGVKDSDDGVQNEIILTSDGTNVKAALNGGTAAEITNPQVIKVCYKHATEEFSVNGTVLTGRVRETLWAYGTLRIGNDESDASLIVTFNGLNGETFEKGASTGSVADKVTPTFLLPEAFNNFTGENEITVPVGFETEFKFKGLDVVNSPTTALTVVPDAKAEGSTDDDYYKKNGAKVLFKKEGTYTVTFKTSDDAGFSEKVIKVVVGAKDTTRPVFDQSQKDDYQAKVTALESNIEMSKKLYLPIPVVTDDYTAYGSMRYKVRYMAPTASTWSYTTVTSGKPYITPSVVGEYKFQIIPVDLSDNYGEYDVGPTFYLTVGTDETAPTISIKLDAKQYLGKTVKLDSVTITEASTYETTKTLEFYNEKTSEWEEVETDGKTLTAEKLGKYRYTVKVVDKYLNSATEVATFEILRPAASETVKSWLQKNYLTAVFIGIAVLCLAGIVVLQIVYKKNEKKNKED